ncbi:hypothetical protein [Amaricoccus sp.]|uniref:hypothetical protein n=1 Tax=Amaricoccus sp. TaxID=1872485 RepID=UPI001B6FDB80|nr:hypothetical protein [Amaricoccus sp.]MBP7240652.1 hypothetical protein [Amaricoccus sp.]
MTALDKYVRLEALGQWREAGGATPREVVVSFGDATLLLTDLSERPLGHWALAGVQAIGKDGPATVYAMTSDGEETLTIKDADMVDAIAAVSRAHRLRDVAPGSQRRRRSLWPWLVVATAAAVLAALGPPLLRAQAARMVPPEAVEEFGDRMLLQIMATRGPLCADAEGRRALATLVARVAEGAPPPRAQALDLGPTPVALLPGPTVALGRTALLQADDPAEIAGWVALALAREAMQPGPERLMAAVGPFADLRYVLTGRLGEPALGRAVEAAMASPGPVEIEAAFERLRTAGLPTAPFADGLRRIGLEAPPASAEGGEALSDRDWVALQGLCR